MTLNYISLNNVFEVRTSHVTGFAQEPLSGMRLRVCRFVRNVLRRRRPLIVS